VLAFQAFEIDFQAFPVLDNTGKLATIIFIPIVCGLFAILVIIIITCFIYRRRKSKQIEENQLRNIVVLSTENENLHQADAIKYLEDNYQIQLFDINKPNGENGCPICLKEFATNDEVYLLECNHIVCTSCLLHWVSQAKVDKCPVCLFNFKLKVYEKINENHTD
jgi:hypothetical protein